jgi:hypothetical protein
LLITSWHASCRNTPFPLLYSNCCIIKNLLPNNLNVVTEPLPRNGHCLQSHHLAADLYATIWLYAAEPTVILKTCSSDQCFLALFGMISGGVRIQVAIYSYLIS